MYQKAWQKCIVLTVLALLLSSSPVVLAQSAQGDEQVFLPLVTYGSDGTADNAVVSDEASAADQEAALAFWSRDKIAAADAMALMVQAGPAAVDAAALAAADTAGPSGFRAPMRAAANADQVARAAFAADWAAAEELSAEDDVALEAGLEAEAANMPEGTSQVYTSYIANWLSTLQTVYPHRWVGRFSFTTPSGTSYCSATAISGNNIVTAAHCVYDTPSRNAFYTNKVFTPAYRNGNAPYGTFATTTCSVLTTWVNLSGAYSINGWAPHDVAVCTVGTNGAGQTLNGAVVAAGRAWNYNYIRHIFNLGYPFRNYANSVLSWAGAYLRLCSAETFQQAAEVRGSGCSWGGGISGGPWVDQVSLSSPTIYGTNGYWPGRASGYVTTVNSGIFVGTQNIYGGRFNSNNIVLLCNARGC
jgi:hypothetical protein